MKKRTPMQRMSEDDFINSATSHTLVAPAPAAKPQGRKRVYKALSVSLTDSHVEMIDEVIMQAARNGIVRITRSDVIKLAVDSLADKSEAQILALLKSI